jgi:predicted MFS family arabinose efflux permease
VPVHRPGGTVRSARPRIVGRPRAAILPLVALDGLLAPTARALARAALVSTARPLGLLRETNALVNLVFTANGVLAPVLGGVLIATVGAQSALATNAMSFLLAAHAVRHAALSPATGGQRSGATQLRDALTHVRSHALLGRLLAGDAIVLLFVSTISPVEVAFITGTLGQGNAALGAVLTAWGAGMVAGGVATTQLRNTAPRVLLSTATLALAVSCLGVAASTSIGAVLAWSIVGGLGNGAYGVAFLTVVQERTADVYQARVGALYETVASVAPGLGFVLGGAVAATMSPRVVYLLAGAGALTALAWAAATLRSADWSCPDPALTG